jgi:hypothetical protein
MSSIPTIYKYPNFKKLVELNSKINPIFVNPHANLIEFARHNKVKPYWISRHPSNAAIEMMIANPKLVHIDSLLLNTNPKIGPLLEMHKHKIQKKHWRIMSESNNPAVLEFLEKHPEQIFWYYLSFNNCESAIRILEKNQDKIDWSALSTNPFAIEILRNNMDKIDWVLFCKNTSPQAIEIIEQMLIENPNIIHIESLSTNPNAIHIISQHLDKLYSPSCLSLNPNAAHILEQHPHLIDFTNILYNSGAINYLKTQIDDINFGDIVKLCGNPKCIPVIQKIIDEELISPGELRYITGQLLVDKPFVYELDYQKMSKYRSNIIYNELVAEALTPDRISKWLDYYCENGGDAFDFDWN